MILCDGFTSQLHQKYPSARGFSKANTDPGAQQSLERSGILILVPPVSGDCCMIRERGKGTPPHPRTESPFSHWQIVADLKTKS